MGERDEELTLKGLAERMETLERENAELRSELTALRGSGGRRDRARDQGMPRVEEARVSRRALLGKAGAAALGTVAAGALMLRDAPGAKAHVTNQIIQAHQVLTHTLRAEPHSGGVPVRGVQNSSVQAAVYGTNAGSWVGVEGGASGAGAGVHGANDGPGPGVSGRGAGSGPGVRGDGVVGVWGASLTNGQAGIYGQTSSGIVGPGVVGDGRGSNYAGVWGRNPGGTGVQGEGSTTAEVAGVRGLGKTGVWGSSAASGYSGVYGQHTGLGYGVVGDGRGGGSSGVLGRNPSGTGVRGESSTVGHAAVLGKHSNAGFDSIGVLGDTVDGVGVKGIGKNGVIGEAPTLGHAAVYGRHIGSAGYGVVGDGTGNGAGVVGRNAAGIGVQGEGRNGVHGKATSGYGGHFEGGKAQLRLAPNATAAGKPASGNHAQGEIYMDSEATLWVCTVGGTPGTWRKVATTAN